MFLLKGLIVTMTIFGIAAAALVLAGQLGLLAGKRPFDLGTRDGRLKPCPATRNCVCSQTTNAAELIEPFRYLGNGVQAFARLKHLVSHWPGAVVASEAEDYLHAEFATRWLRFVDDVEFLFDHGAGVIHVRSASRLGYSDLGTNRRRVEAIRARFDAG